MPPKVKNRPAAPGRRNLNSPKLYDEHTSNAITNARQGRVLSSVELNLMAAAQSLEEVEEIAFTTDKDGARIAIRPVPEGFSGESKPEDVSCLWLVTNLLDGMGTPGREDDGVMRDMLDAALRLLDGRTLLPRSDRQALHRVPWYRHHLEARDGPYTRALEDAIECNWLDKEQGAYLIRRVVHLCRIVRDLIAVHHEDDTVAPAPQPKASSRRRTRSAAPPDAVPHAAA
jgi:hypothetical protein